MRLLTSAGTPRELLARAWLWLIALSVPNGALIVILLVAARDQVAAIAVSFRAAALA